MNLNYVSPQPAVQQPQYIITKTYLRYEDGLYFGDTLNTSNGSVPHGFGELIFPGDICYIGEWHNGHEHGWGRLMWSNGCSFTGMFNEGKAVDEALLKHVYDIGIQQKGEHAAWQQKLLLHNNWPLTAFPQELLFNSSTPHETSQAELFDD